MTGKWKKPHRRKERKDHPEWERAAALATHLFQYMPTPGSKKFIMEATVDFPTGIPGVKTFGYSDFTDLTEGFEGTTDYKSTSNFRWAKSEEELKTDPQCIIYTRFVFKKCDAEEVYFRHLYVRTTDKPKKQEPHKEVIITVTREENEAAWLVLVEDIKEMLVLSRHKGPFKEIKPNYGACGDFRGCPFKSECDAVDCRGPFDGLPDTTPEPEVLIKNPNTKLGKAMTSVFAKLKEKKAQLLKIKAEVALKETTSVDPEMGSGLINPQERPSTSEAKVAQDAEMSAKVEKKHRDEEAAATKLAEKQKKKEERAAAKAEKEEAKKSKEAAKAPTKTKEETKLTGQINVSIVYAKDADLADFICGRILGLDNAGQRIVGIAVQVDNSIVITHTDK